MPGRYTVAVLSQKQDVTVEPDPRFSISDADRQKRHAAIASAYSMQQQLTPAREAAVSLTEQLAALRQYFVALGESGKPLQAIDKLSGEISRAQGQVDRAIGAGAQVQNAIDGYDGLPTAQQLHQLDWAWEDAAAAVSGWNKVVSESVPATFASLGVKPPVVKPVAVPAR